MQNPLVTLRLLTTKTTTDLSKNAQVSKQYISRAERGMLPAQSLNNTYLNVLINSAAVEGLTEQEIRRLYRDWQAWKRNDTITNKGLSPVADVLFQSVSQPNVGELTSTTGKVFWYRVFSTWRHSNWDTIYAFCMDMCCRLFDVERYENGKCSHIPANLRKALGQVELLNGFNTEER